MRELGNRARTPVPAETAVRHFDHGLHKAAACEMVARAIRSKKASGNG